MGYLIFQKETQFLMLQTKIEAAYKAVLGLVGQETIKDSSGRHFLFVSKNWYRLPTLVDILKEWNWKVGLDENGNFCSITFIGEKQDNSYLLFSKLAPFVEEGSSIEIEGEDGKRWRWVFNDNKCRLEKLQEGTEWSPEGYPDPGHWNGLGV